MILKTYYISQSIVEEFSKAYFPAKNQKGTAEATKGMMRLLPLGHLSFRIWSKQEGVINPWLRRQIDKKKKKSAIIFSSTWFPG